MPTDEYDDPVDTPDTPEPAQPPPESAQPPPEAAQPPPEPAPVPPAPPPPGHVVHAIPPSDLSLNFFPPAEQLEEQVTHSYRRRVEQLTGGVSTYAAETFIPAATIFVTNAKPEEPCALPQGGVIPVEGYTTTSDDMYIMRRIRDGSVIQGTPP